MADERTKKRSTSAEKVGGAEPAECNCVAGVAQCAVAPDCRLCGIASNGSTKLDTKQGELNGKFSHRHEQCFLCAIP